MAQPLTVNMRCIEWREQHYEGVRMAYGDTYSIGLWHDIDGNSNKIIRQDRGFGIKNTG